MSTQPPDHLDAARSRQRETLRELEAQLGLLATAPAELHATFARLVTQLALGPEPELRNCPSCGALGMRAATLCGSCWVKLTPPAVTAS